MVQTREPASRPARPRVLVADDQPDVLEALRQLLKSDGCEVELAGSPAGVLEALEGAPFDLLLMDLNYARDTTSGREGVDLIRRVRAVDEGLPIIVMTAWGSIELAVETLRGGAGDFVQKPWHNARLLETVRAQVASGRERRETMHRERDRQAEERTALERLRGQDRELGDASAVQRELYPRRLPRVPGLELAASSRAARRLCGDHYEALEAGPGRVALFVADVMGKGVAAALLMSNLQAAIEGLAERGLEPAALCRELNRHLARHVADGRFVSLVHALVDLPGRRLTVVNAGHNPPVLVRADGTCARGEPGGPVLGAFPDADYESWDASLAPGDRLLLFTDGLTEALDGRGEEYGEPRLVERACALRALGAEALHAAVLEDVLAFAAGVFHDDATLVVAAVD